MSAGSAQAAGPALDPCDARFARSATGLLREFNAAGVLTAADVHVATRLAAMAGEDDEWVALAAALAVRAPRLGHVHVDLGRIEQTAAVESEDGLELGALPWPEVQAWLGRLTRSGLVAVGEADGGPIRPLRLIGSRLYLDRYWAEERQVADDLLALGRGTAGEVDEPWLQRELRRLLPEEGEQRVAAANALLRRLSVIAGGPGTGKTTTVSRVAALFFEQAAVGQRRLPLIGLAAPTGKAAARLEEAVHAEARELPVSEPVRAALLGLEAMTLHRLLGRRPDSDSRFRHDRRQHLPHDVIVVDETSMVPLSLMARLIEAVRPTARLVLVGDPGQLASIEAGAVLGDIVGPAAREPAMSAASARRLEALSGVAVESRGSAGPEDRADAPPIAASIVVLRRGHRFGGAIAALADAVREGDADAALDLLADGPPELVWLPVSAADDALEPVREVATRAAVRLVETARAGEARPALDTLGEFRLLCAHRRGPYGVSAWSARVETWLSGGVADFDPEQRWYPGRPLLITENDYELGLYNGDTGVIVARPDGGRAAAFQRRGEILEYSPSRLAAFDTLYAMTIHKSQGSQFATAAVLLPDPGSRILTRELLYTALTRARERLIVAAPEASIRAAIDRPIARASGLGQRLWGADPE